VLESIEDWPQRTLRARQHFERSRWTTRFLYETALRASEAARAKASDFFRQRGRWWLRVVGKGGLEAVVPLSDDLMREFARYRSFVGLPAIPSPLESNPAIMTVVGRVDRHMTPTAIYLLVKRGFQAAAQSRKATDPVGAEKLNRASTHWIRHTSASHQADAGTDLRFIQRNLRHASIGTTSIYLHAEEDQRHDQTTRQSSSAFG
jgi:integrase/recombinase XerC